MKFENIQKIVIDLITKRAEFALLLGSAATPRFKTDSDVDIAVFWKGEEIEYKEKVTLVNSFEDQLGHPVDLISLNNIDVIYGIQVVQTGRLLFCNDLGLLLKWKASQLSKYPDFKRSRAIIEDNILNRKKYV